MAKPTFSDFDMAFIDHPVHGDITRLLDVVAIVRSMKNLLLTNRGDYGFEPNLGSSLRKTLFEQSSPFVDAMMAEVIKETLDNFEPRVIVNAIGIDFDHAGDGYNITISYTVKPFQKQFTGNFFLGRQ